MPATVTCASPIARHAKVPRDIVYVPNWFTCCEILPELPSLQGWVEAMTSLGRLIFFDQPGTGASDAVSPGALPTLEQWADSITAVLDDLGSREAVLLASAGAFATRRCSPRHIRPAPPRWSCSRVTQIRWRHAIDRDEVLKLPRSACGATGETQHVINPDMPWNEEIRATWARKERLAASPATVALMTALVIGSGRTGAASHSPRANPGPSPHRGFDDPARVGQIRRRQHLRREVR